MSSDTITPSKALETIRAMATRSVPNCVNLDAIDRVRATVDFTDYKAAYEKLSKLLDASVRPVDEWVSVKERLPENPNEGVWNHRVLIARPGCDVKTGFYDNGGWYAEGEDYDGDPLLDNTVTHWRPLPKAPVPVITQEGGGMIAVRSYEFQYGLLHLELSEARHHTTEDIIESYGGGKGKLLDVRDGEMPARQLAALSNFREL